MKLEKVNEHQIRATLTKADLADRELKLSELAYGTEKAKNLFRDMMQQAAYEFGFEAEDIPLMIEAIPMSSESIVLIITKVEDPEELDTRFSNFAPTIHDEDQDAGLNNMLQALSEETDNVLDLFRKIKENSADKTGTVAPRQQSAPADEAATEELTRAYSFPNIDTAARVAHLLEPFFFGKSSLYRNVQSGRVILVVSKSSHTPEDFNRVCNMISEYGSPVRYNTASEAFFQEHNEAIMVDNALTRLLFV
ncbi:MAG: adaptor protein MecA [Lachnospiraceae bacterium]|nr:adaptor protein MecA [Lachnospiraceae bacterium]